MAGHARANVRRGPSPDLLRRLPSFSGARRQGTDIGVGVLGGDLEVSWRSASRPPRPLNPQVTAAACATMVAVRFQSGVVPAGRRREAHLVQERRARLAVRHRLAPGHRARKVVDAAESVVCLHATDPATVYLSAWARMDDMTVADLDGALRRSFHRQAPGHATNAVRVPWRAAAAVRAGGSEATGWRMRSAAVSSRRSKRRASTATATAGCLSACDEVLAALAGGRKPARPSSARRSRRSRAR